MIQLLGIDFPAQALGDLAGQLAPLFRTTCRVRPERLDVSFAYDARRNQYCSTAILAAMQRLVENGTRLLAVTEFDLYVPVLTFVFGEAQLEGCCAVVSTHRLREEFYGLPAREDLRRDRLLKESAHELGHTCGLRHCDDWRCVMASSHGVELIDVKGAGFCGVCARAAGV